MQLFLIRHGQSYINLPDWTGGHQDTGLTALGANQATALGAWIGSYLPHVDVLYCSSMQRARETAQPVVISFQLPVVYDDRLREVGNNQADGTALPNHNLPQKYIGFPNFATPYISVSIDRPETESYAQFRSRVGAFIEFIKTEHADQIVVAVTHGGVIESAIRHIMNACLMPTDEIWTANTGITHLEYFSSHGRNGWRMHFHNRIDHLTKELVS